jgi:hypothetical protein
LRSFLTPLTVAANNISKTYNGLTDSTPSYTNTLTGATLIPNNNLLGTATGYGNAKNIGTYSFSGAGLYANQQGYDITNGTGTLTINKAALSITANAGSKLYDGLAYSGGNGVSYAGFVNGEGLSVLAGALAYGGNSQGAIQAGTYSIVPEGLSSANYAISYLNGSLVITQTPVIPAPVNTSNTVPPSIVVTENSIASNTNQTQKSEKPIVQVITKQPIRDTYNLEEQLVPLQVATTFTEGKSEKVDYDEKRKPSKSEAWIEIENRGIKLP